MDFRKSATTAVVIGFVGGAFLLGGVMLGGGSSGNTSSLVVTRTETPGVTPTVGAGGLTVGTADPSTADQNNDNGGISLPTDGGSAGTGSDSDGLGNGNNDGGNPAPQPQPQQPEPLQPSPDQPEPQPPVIEPEPEPEPDGPVLELAPPSIMSTTPAHTSTGNIRGTNIQFRFNQEMDKASANEAFAMLSPVVDGTISWDETGRIMTFNPAVDFA